MNHPYDISAVIPVREGEEGPVCWKMQGKTLLERAMDAVRGAATGIRHMVVVGRTLKVFDGFSPPSDVSVLDVDLPAAPGTDVHDPLGGVCALATAVAAHIPELRNNGGGLMFLDPLRPLIRSNEIRNAVESFRLPGPEAHGRTGVVGVSLLRNHHHPRKILRITEHGDLAHFMNEGKTVFQRQQLEGDDYYVIDPALVVFGRSLPEAPWDPTGWIAVPLGDGGVRVESPETLELAEALARL